MVISRTTSLSNSCKYASAFMFSCMKKEPKIWPFPQTAAQTVAFSREYVISKLNSGGLHLFLNTFVNSCWSIQGKCYFITYNNLAKKTISRKFHVFALWHTDDNSNLTLQLNVDGGKHSQFLQNTPFDVATIIDFDLHNYLLLRVIMQTII